MKKVLQFSGFISLALAVVAFILMMSTVAILVPAILGGNSAVTGVQAIFGYETALGAHVNGSVLALIGWILALLGLVVVLAGIILPLLKVKGADKFAGLLNLCAVICFAVAGVFCFIVVPTFYGANDVNVPEKAAIGAGWVFAGILYIAAGVFAILPAIADFLGKGKKK